MILLAENLSIVKTETTKAQNMNLLAEENIQSEWLNGPSSVIEVKIDNPKKMQKILMKDRMKSREGFPMYNAHIESVDIISRNELPLESLFWAYKKAYIVYENTRIDWVIATVSLLYIIDARLISR